MDHIGFVPPIVKKLARGVREATDNDNAIMPLFQITFFPHGARAVSESASL